MDPPLFRMGTTGVTHGENLTGSRIPSATPQLSLDMHMVLVVHGRTGALCYVSDRDEL